MRKYNLKPTDGLYRLLTALIDEGDRKTYDWLNQAISRSADVTSSSCWIQPGFELMFHVDIATASA